MTRRIENTTVTIDTENAYYSGNDQWQMDATDADGNEYNVYVSAEYAEQMDDSDFDWENATISEK